jgi:hypothetical protein
MDTQEPGRDYYEYYYDHEQMQRPTYRDGDCEAENLHRRPRLPASSAPPLTSCGLVYSSYAIAGDGTEQTRMPRISRPSDSSAYASYPLHAAHSLATAHPIHRQSTVNYTTAIQQILTMTLAIQQINGASGDLPSYAGAYFHLSQAAQAEGVYRIQTRNLETCPSNQNTSAELHAQPAQPNVAMGPVYTPLPEPCPVEAFPLDLPSPPGNTLYRERPYSSQHTLGNTSHTPIYRPPSLRQSVRVREPPASNGRLYCPRESYSWAQNPGPDLPHPVASSPTNPAQQDFRTLHGSQASINDSLDESTESGPSNEAVVSDMTSDTTHGNNGTPPLAPLRTLDEIYEHFPHQNSRHKLMRARLLEVMNASWRRMNEKEPDPQALLQFTSKIDENGSEKYKCLIWLEGTECGKKIPRCVTLTLNSSFR